MSLLGWEPVFAGGGDWLNGQPPSALPELRPEHVKPGRGAPGFYLGAGTWLNERVLFGGGWAFQPRPALCHPICRRVADGARTEVPTSMVQVPDARALWRSVGGGRNK